MVIHTIRFARLALLMPGLPVLMLGTTEPVAGVDLELTRVGDEQGTSMLQASPQGASAASPAPQPPPPQAPYTAKTGNDGKLVFRNLPSGAYKLVAGHIEGLFTPVEYGQRGVLGRGVTFPTGNGQEVRNIKLEMAPVGISARVFDEHGERRANGPGLPITIAANQTITDVSIAMTPTVTISGRTTDSSGQPIVLADEDRGTPVRVGEAERPTINLSVIPPLQTN